MSIILHLGVYDVPYTKGGMTTGGVAEILENRYSVMENFYELNSKDIADSLRDSLNNALFSVKNGADILQLKPFDGAVSKIQTKFRKFIQNEDIIKSENTFLSTGRTLKNGKSIRLTVPTQAALMGYSSRLKKFKGARRPSFRDTGMYESNFTAWVEIK